MNRPIAAAALSLSLALAAPAMAEPVGFRYEIMWGGFHAGDLAITRDDATGQVRTGMTIRTVGLFDRFLRLRFSAEGGSRPSDGSILVSDHYQTRFRNRYQETLLRVAYAPEARVVTDEVLEVFAPPPEDDSPNPPVPDDLRRGVMDPLTNMALAGMRAREALAGGAASFRTTSFDGRRAYDFETRVIGPRRINMRGRDYDAIHVIMTLKPLAGFKPKFVKLWDGAEYEVDIDPVSLLPLRIRTDSFTAATVINALEPCTVAAAQCGPVATAQGD